MLIILLTSLTLFCCKIGIRIMIIKFHLFIIHSTIIVSLFILLILILHLFVHANLSYIVNCINITSVLVTY